MKFRGFDTFFLYVLRDLIDASVSNTPVSKVHRKYQGDGGKLGKKFKVLYNSFLNKGFIILLEPKFGTKSQLVVTDKGILLYNTLKIATALWKNPDDPKVFRMAEELLSDLKVLNGGDKK